MASLMEELIATLTAEKEVYEKLLPVSQRKKRTLIEDDLQGLQEVTDQEQELMDRLAALEHKRTEVIQNMGIVLNRDPESLDLVTIGNILTNRPEEKKQIAALHDGLREVANRLVAINEQNKALIEQSLELIEFNMNFIQSTRMSPGSNNYTKDAGTSDTGSTGVPSSFDAKQ